MPDMVGLATHYGPPTNCQGDTTSSGRPLNLWGQTAAVDVSLRDTLLNEEIYVLTECGQIYKVLVTDTGRLYKAGWWRLGVRGSVRRYWHVDEDWGEPVLPYTPIPTKWLEDKSYQMVLDFPIYFRKSIPCKPGKTMKVAVWHTQ